MIMILGRRKYMHVCAGEVVSERIRPCLVCPPKFFHPSHRIFGHACVDAKGQKPIGADELIHWPEEDGRR